MDQVVEFCYRSEDFNKRFFKVYTKVENPDNYLKNAVTVIEGITNMGLFQFAIMNKPKEKVYEMVCKWIQNDMEEMQKHGKENIDYWFDEYEVEGTNIWIK